MNQTNDEFERIPGQGYVFFKGNQPDVRTKSEAKAHAEKKTVPMVSIWRGWLALPGGTEVQVRMLGYTRTRKYHVALHNFPHDDAQDDSAWEKLAEFELPSFGHYEYVEGEVGIDGRIYKVRAIKNPGGFIHLRLPQVVNTRAAYNAMM